MVEYGPERPKRPGDGEPWPARSFTGKRMYGDILRFDATRTESAIELIIAEEHGPRQRFTLYWSERSPALRRSERAASAVKFGASFAVLLAASMVVFMTPDDPDTWAMSPFLGLPVMVVCLVVAAVLARSYFWEGNTRRYQFCRHCQGLPETIAAAGDPRGQAWAIEALDALRNAQFCRDSAKLHLMMKRPVAQLLADRSETRAVAGLVLDAAIALREHGRLTDATDVLLCVDVVPSLSVLDSETARQAAQTILDSYQLLDDIAVDRRTVIPDGGSTTPTEDATAAVDAALRGIDQIVDSATATDIQALQALRIYSKRWDTAPGGE